jgi:hypothetical protein
MKPVDVLSYGAKYLGYAWRYKHIIQKFTIKNKGTLPSPGHAGGIPGTLGITNDGAQFLVAVSLGEIIDRYTFGVGTWEKIIKILWLLGCLVVFSRLGEQVQTPN